MTSVSSAIVQALVISIFYGIPCNSQQAGCNFNISRDIPIQREPIYLTNNDGHLQLFNPAGQNTYFPINSVLTLYCPGDRQLKDKPPRPITISNRDTKRVDLTCRNNQFMEGDNPISLFDVTCTDFVPSDVAETRVSCANNKGYFINIGFQIENQFFKTFEICYDRQSDKAFYSKHSLDGEAVTYRNIVRCSTHRFFKPGGSLRSEEAMKAIYATEKQIQQFVHLFGPGQRYITRGGRNFLNKGHLTASNHFVYDNFRRATCYYINSAPQFATINGGNWNGVETLVQRLSTKAKTEFLVYTGTHGTLTLPREDDQSRRQEVVLSDEQGNIAVPMWFWKVVKNVRDDSAIVFITSNNPFATEAVGFCPNVLAEASIVDRKYQELAKGYTFACKLDEFKRKVDYLPTDLSASKLLKNSR